MPTTVDEEAAYISTVTLLDSPLEMLLRTTRFEFEHHTLQTKRVFDDEELQTFVASDFHILCLELAYPLNDSSTKSVGSSHHN